jgi:hypothetical protein
MTRILLLAAGDRMAGVPTCWEISAGAVPADVIVEDVRAEPAWHTAQAMMLAPARRARGDRTRT